MREEGGWRRAWKKGVEEREGKWEGERERNGWLWNRRNRDLRFLIQIWLEFESFCVSLCPNIK